MILVFENDDKTNDDCADENIKRIGTYEDAIIDLCFEGADE